MAEIKITKKNKWWPWIVILLLVLVVIGYFMIKAEDTLVEEDVTLEAVEAISAMENDSSYAKSNLEITEYISFIGDKSKLGTDIQYTKKALIQLSTAVRMTARKYELNIGNQLENLEDSIMDIEKEHDSLRLAALIKNIGGEIAQIVQILQQKEFPELAEEPMKIKKAVDGVIAGQQINEQKKQIIAFFDACGNALKKMK